MDGLKDWVLGGGRNRGSEAEGADEFAVRPGDDVRADELAHALGGLGALGVAHLQVRLMARSRDELCDQIAAFGAQVGPHLTRKDLD